MTRKLLFTVVFALLCGAKIVFASGKADSAKMTLTLINNTGAIIESVVISPSVGESIVQIYTMRKDDSLTVTVPRCDYFDVYARDTKQHAYGIFDIGWTSGGEMKLPITKKDFVSQGVWDSVKKRIGM
jgi:hypothetical protein